MWIAGPLKLRPFWIWPRDPMAILKTRKLTKVYNSGAEPVTVLDGVSLSVDKGEFVVITGDSGSGKTTLLSLLSGLDDPSGGKVFINGADITVMSENELALLRNRTFGFVFQSFHLIPSLTALENVMFPAELAQDPKARSKALDLLTQLGVAHCRGRFPYQLSGGEKQRVAIGRALINEPDILFADEPTGNLDTQNSRGIVALLESAYRSRAMTLVMVTHNEAIAERADRRFILKEGRLAAGDEDAP